MTRRVKEPLEVKDLDIAGIPIGSAVFGGFLATLTSELVDSFIPTSKKRIKGATKAAIASLVADKLPLLVLTPRIITKLRLTKRYWVFVFWLNKHYLTRWLVARSVRSYKAWEASGKTTGILLAFDALRDIFRDFNKEGQG